MVETSADDNNNEESNNIKSNLLPRRKVLYCGACGMPLEYCEYGPDFETHCNPWLKKFNPTLFQELRGKTTSVVAAVEKPPRPSQPWTTQERLTAFYQKYVPEKLDSIPSLLEKYAGKEEKLFQALVSKYGDEPLDPYFSESDADDGDDHKDDDDGEDEDDHDAQPSETAASVVAAAAADDRKKRRGVAAKKEVVLAAEGMQRVVVQKVAQKKKRNLTVIMGLETVSTKISLKDASKAFSKKFAGSSSVKKNIKGGEDIIIQGDHVYDVAEMIVDKFNVPDTAVFIDIGDGEIVPLRS